MVELERGAIYVDTEGSAPQHNIEVRTRLGTISDVGTQFEVRLEGDTVQLTVRTGAASLTRDGRKSPAPAGTRLRLNAAGAVESGQAPAEGTEWDWAQAIAPPFELEGHTLGEYLDWLGRETGRPTPAAPRPAPPCRTGRTARSASRSGRRDCRLRRPEDGAR